MGSSFTTPSGRRTKPVIFPRWRPPPVRSGRLSTTMAMVSTRPRAIAMIWRTTFFQGLTAGAVMRSIGIVTDWHLPDIYELQSIVDYAREAPAIDQTYFSNTQSHLFWTTTVAGENNPNRIYIDFKDGRSKFKPDDEQYRVRCVRRNSSTAPQPDQRFIKTEGSAEGWIVLDQLTGLVWSACTSDDGSEACGGGGWAR